MIITITGASGKTGSQAAKHLVGKGNTIRVVGRSAEHLNAFKDNGAELFIGDQHDAKFLTNALTNSDVAYLLIPPKFDTRNIRDYYREMGETIIKAIRDSRVKKVVFLSSLGADQDSGVGPVLGLRDVEQMLIKEKGTDILILRPGYFMENLMTSIPVIKAQKIFPGSASPSAPIQMIATRDIGIEVALHLGKPTFSGYSIKELFGDRITSEEAARIIGKAIDIDPLPYIQVPDVDMLKAMTGMGLSESVASSYIELSQGISKGLVKSHVIDPSKPNMPTRFSEFVNDIFAPAYLSS